MTMTVIDIEKADDLLSYLRQEALVAKDELPAIYKLEGGVSNRTMLVKRENDEAWVLKQALAKLRVQVDWFSDPARVHREAEGLRWLLELAPAGTVPAFIHEDLDQHILIMRAVPEPHQNWKQMLLDGDLQDDHVQQFGQLLAEIHVNAFRCQDEVASAFADRSFFESLRLEPYYAYTATKVPEAAIFLNALIDETRRQRLTLVHGDYSPKNILVYDGRLILLDHEVIHFGDPAFDLGFSLTHLLSKAHYLRDQRNRFAAAARLYWQTYYQNMVGMPWAEVLEPRTVRHTLACLLARVSGRSPLEYMDEEERARQRQTVISLLADPPPSIDTLIDEFIQGIDPHANH